MLEDLAKRDDLKWQDGSHFAMKFKTAYLHTSKHNTIQLVSNSSKMADEMREINHTVSIQSHAPNLKTCGWALLLVTHILLKQKKERKKSIHAETTSTFLAQFLTSWQNGDSLIWYIVIIFFLLSQQSITNYILKNGYTLFCSGLIMARWWLYYEKKNGLPLPVCRLLKHLTINERRNKSRGDREALWDT